MGPDGRRIPDIGRVVLRFRDGAWVEDAAVLRCHVVHHAVAGVRSRTDITHDVLCWYSDGHQTVVTDAWTWKDGC